MKERFLSYTKQDGDCIVWTGAKMWSGYGLFYVGGKGRSRNNTARAHRVSYMLHIGEIPDGMHVLHKCDNRSCVNPDHLFLGNHADNMRDKASKGRATSKMTATDVREIRAATGLTQEELGKRFGLTQPTISAIVNHRTWQHVKQEG